MSTQYLSPHHNTLAATNALHQTHSPPVLIPLHLWNIHSNLPPLSLLDTCSHTCPCPPPFRKAPSNSHDGPTHTVLTQQKFKFHIQISSASLSTSMLIKLVPVEILSLLHFKMGGYRVLPLLRDLKQGSKLGLLEGGLPDGPNDHEFFKPSLWKTFDTTENPEFSTKEERWKGGKKKDLAHNTP